MNRLQSYEQAVELIEAARACGFRSINIDLIYGLPKQHAAGFADTLRKTIAAAPDRIALYHYAHLPTLFKPQRRIAAADLPSLQEKARMFEQAVSVPSAVMKAVMIIVTHVRAPLQKENERERGVLCGGGKIVPWRTTPPRVRAAAMGKTSWCYGLGGKPVERWASAKWKARVHGPKAKRKEEELRGRRLPERA